MNDDRINRIESTRLLEERPAAESNYEGHDIIAGSLFHTIAGSQDSQFVALLGGLGSGKSTIIRRIEKKAEDSRPIAGTAHKVTDRPSSDAQQRESPATDVRVFTFDAWTHAGESTRRSFIQELIEWLRNTLDVRPGKGEKKGGDQEVWQEQEDRIVRRTTETKQTVSTSPTWFGYTLLALTIIGTGYFRYVFAYLYGDDVSTSSLGIIFPLLVIVIVSLLFFIHNLCKPKDSIEDQPSLVDRHTETNISTQADRNSPSSFDFREALGTILRDALEVHEIQRLVVVIDNIDRLTDPQEIKPVLKLIQILHDLRNQGGEHGDWQKRLWVIAPFSKQALYSAMSDEVGDLLPRYLIDKSFQVQITIPSPLYTQWRDHLRKKLNEAFRGTGGSSSRVSEDDLRLVESIVAHQVPKRGENPRTRRGIITTGERTNQGLTRRPRDINRFVNDLVMQYRMRGDNEISLPVIAFYVAESIGLDGKELLTTEFRSHPDDLALPSATIGVSRDALLDHLYALDYGVSVSEAIEYRLADDLEDALDECRRSTHQGSAIAQKAIDHYLEGERANERTIGTLLSDAITGILARPSMPLLLHTALLIQKVKHIDDARDNLLSEIDEVLLQLTTFNIRDTGASELADYINGRSESERNRLQEIVLQKLGETVHLTEKRTPGAEEESTTDGSPSPSEEPDEDAFGAQKDSIDRDKWVDFLFDFIKKLSTNFNELALFLSVPGTVPQYLRAVRDLMHRQRDYSGKPPHLKSNALQPLEVNLTHKMDQVRVESLVSPEFKSTKTLEERLGCVPAAVHLINMHSDQLSRQWEWAKIISAVYKFLGGMSVQNDPFPYKELLSVVLAKEIADPGYGRRVQDTDIQTLLGFLGDQRLPSITDEVAVATAVLLALRDYEVSRESFTDVDPAHDAIDRTRERIDWGRTGDPKLLQNLAERIPIDCARINHRHKYIRNFLCP